MMFLQVHQIQLGLEQMFCFCSQSLKIFTNNKSQNIWIGQTEIINRNKYIWQVLNKMDKIYFDKFFPLNFRTLMLISNTLEVVPSSPLKMINENEKNPHLKLKSNPKQHIKNVIKCLIQNLNDQEVEWVILNSQINQISRYFANNEPFQQMNTLLKAIVDQYEQRPHIGWLQILQSGMMYYEDKLPQKYYKTIINSLTLTIANFTLKTYQQNNNNIKQSRSNNISTQQSSNQKKQKQPIKQSQSVQQSHYMPQIEKNIGGENFQLCEHWRKFIEFVRSYVFQCVKNLNFVDFWLFFDLILSLVLDNAVINSNSYQSDKIIYEIIVKFQKIISSQIFNGIYHNFLHEICLFFRIYFSRMKQFLENDSKIIRPSPKYPLVNHCSLIMRFIQKQLTNQQISLSKQQKLDCLMLLISILSIKLPKSANYNQVLQFALHIVLFICQQEEAESFKPQKISSITFYCAQLVSMIMYINIDWLIQFCKKSQEHIQGKYLKRVLQIYRKGLLHLKRNIINKEYQLYIYFRFMFGFCGLMTVQKMDSCIQDFIRDNFCHVVKILEISHGWNGQQQEQLEQEQQEQLKQQKQDGQYKKKQQEQFEQYEQLEKQEQQEKQGQEEMFQYYEMKKRIKERKEEFYEQRMYLNIQKQDEGFEMKEQNQQNGISSNDEEVVFWNEQFYHKNSLASIQDTDEINLLKKSMVAVKNHNPELFEILLNHFTQKQMILWVVELEREEEDGSDDD